MPRSSRLLAIACGGCLALCSPPISAQVQSQNGTDDLKRINTGQFSVQSQQNASQDTAPSNSGSSNHQPDELTANPGGAPAANRASSQQDSVQVERLSEFEQFVSGLAVRRIRRFGAELLLPASRDFVAPPTTAVPPDYRINPGDELVIGLTGSVEANNLRLTVDQEGRIFFPKVGPVRVGGIPYRDLQEVIVSQVARQYRYFRVSVSIGALHGITVYVTGFAAAPGSYTVSSLSTLINAVLAAGGPSAGGSFRSIQVRRSGRLVVDFDLYDFLLKGDKKNDIVLQNGDVITVAPSGEQVAVLGSVNREAIYEARAGDMLNDILIYAGGANTVADLSRLYILDPTGGSGWQEMPPQAALTRKASRGEVLRVLSAVGIALPSQRLQSLVTVSGEVMAPGRYFVKPGTSLDQVVQLAGGLTPQAYAFGAVFRRESLRLTQQANFEKVVTEIKIALTAQPLVSANTRDTDMASRLATVNALVEQLRARHIEGRLVFESSPGENDVPGSFLVENNDELYIPQQSLAIGVAGMVNSSSNFRYAPGRTVRDYITLAGGFSRSADKNDVLLVRANGSLLGSRLALGTKVVPGDQIFVPVDSQRGAFWAKLRELTSSAFQSALVAATVIAATK